MADLRIRATWTIDLSTDELVLLCRALRCKLTTPDQRINAADLADKLGELRAKTLIQQGDQARTLLDNIDANRKERSHADVSHSVQEP
jgi:hypothetical protein